MIEPGCRKIVSAPGWPAGQPPNGASVFAATMPARSEHAPPTKIPGGSSGTVTKLFAGTGSGGAAATVKAVALPVGPFMIRVSRRARVSPLPSPGIVQVEVAGSNSAAGSALTNVTPVVLTRTLAPATAVGPLSC